jgi:mono/diheme cytochrome c family protein
LKRKAFAVLGLVLIALAAAFTLLSFWRENWAVNESPGAVERFLAGILLRSSRSVQEIPNPVPLTDAALAEGLDLYEKQCTFCHGPDGGGPDSSGVQFYPPVPSLLSPQNQLTDSQMYFVVQRGIRYTAMPSFAKAMTDDQIWKVILWLRAQATNDVPGNSRFSGEENRP